MSTPRRNEPCPCGSGRKYKHCCLHGPVGESPDLDDGPNAGLGPPFDDAAPKPASDFSTRLREVIGEHEFASLEDAQAFVDDFAANHNDGPLEEFDGLSPHAMHRILHAPFDSPDVLAIAERLEAEPRAPLLAWFHLIASALGEKGVRATTTGNLPRALSQEAARVAQGDTAYGPEDRYERAPHTVRSEEDVFPLHYARVTARMAGLLRLYRGRWSLTRRAHRLLADGDDRAILLRLFRTLAAQVNWRYGTRIDRFEMVQSAWPFLLRLLQRYGDAPRPAEFYADAMITAFPMLLEEAPVFEWDHADPDATAERARRRARDEITFLAFERFAAPLGLATAEPYAPDPDVPWCQSWTVRATPPAFEVVRFER